MAAPTEVYVEANSQTSTRLFWTDPTAASVGVYRSTDGSSYSLVATVADGTDDYDDVGLAAGTKYWYKLSNDSGSNYSDVVTVWTYGCPPEGERLEGMTLPRFSEGEDPAQRLNELVDAIENRINRIPSTNSDGECFACIDDHAVVIECKCESIFVTVDQDINSIDVINCGWQGTTIEFIIPPGETWGIGGWPRGIGFSGGEGRVPVAGGSAGRRIQEVILPGGMNDNQSSGRSRPGVTTETEDRQGRRRRRNQTASGNCTPGSEGELRVRSTGNSSSYSLDCASSKALSLFACGGRGPYTWGSTGGLNLSGSSGGSIVVQPPTNSGSGVAGNAYRKFKFHRECSNSCNNTDQTTYGCDDSTAGCINLALTSSAKYSASPTCAANQVSGTEMEIEDHGASSGHTPCDSDGTTCDMRSGAMISAGCNPCGVAVSGATVTVTDSLGTQVTIAVTN